MGEWRDERVEVVRGLLWGTLKCLNCATSKVCLKVHWKFGLPYQETFSGNITLIQSKY